MAIIEGELLNLRAFLGGASASDPEAIPDGATGWAGMIEAAQRLLLEQQGGGTIFFGPGRYLVETQGLVIAPEITLWFSPGAVIDPWLPATGLLVDVANADRSVGVLEIRGRIQAAPHMIFFPRSSRAYLPRGFGSPRAHGEVILAGEQVEDVYPEWWGAGQRDEQDRSLDSHAIDAALRAAWTNRWESPSNGRALGERILAMDDRGVIFVTKAGRQRTFPGVEFLRRFVDHVLPSGLHAHPSLRPPRAVPRDHYPREGARVAHACDGHTRLDRPSLHLHADRPRDSADVDRHASRADRTRPGTLPSVHFGAPGPDSLRGAIDSRRSGHLVTRSTHSPPRPFRVSFLRHSMATSARVTHEDPLAHLDGTAPRRRDPPAAHRTPVGALDRRPRHRDGGYRRSMAEPISP